MPFDGLAGLHCMVLPAYVFLKSNEAGLFIPPSSSTVGGWRGLAMSPIAALHKRILESRIGHDELFARGLSDPSIASIFETYFTTLTPFSTTPMMNTDAKGAANSTIDAQTALESARVIESVVGTTNLRFGVGLRSPYSAPADGFRLTDPTYIYGTMETFVDIVAQGVVDRMVDNFSFHRSVVASFYSQHPGSTCPHLINIPGNTTTQKSFFIIPLGVSPKPNVLATLGIHSQSMARWWIFCKMMTSTAPHALTNDAKGFEFCQIPPEGRRNPILHNENSGVSRTQLRLVKRSAKTAPYQSVCYSLQKYYDIIQGVFVSAPTDPVSISHVERLLSKAHNWLFCTRLPTTMWNHAVAFPFPQSISIASIDFSTTLAKKRRAVNTALLGSGTYGAVVKMQWVFDDTPAADGNPTEERLSPNVENMALANELWQYARLLRSFESVESKSSFDIAALRGAISKSSIPKISLDFTPSFDKLGSNPTPISFPLALVEPEEIQKDRNAQNLFYSACVDVVESMATIMMEAEDDKYGPPPTISASEVSSSFLPIDQAEEGAWKITHRLLRAYSKYASSALDYALGIRSMQQRSISDEIVALLKRVSGGKWSISLHTKVAAALKQSKDGKEDFMTECALMQFFSSYALSPSSVDGLYSILSSPVPIVSVPVRRCDVNQVPQLRSRYLSAVHPEDRSLNPRAVIQRSDDFKKRLQMIFVDDDGSVISVHRNIEPLPEHSEVLKLPILSRYSEIDEMMKAKAKVGGFGTSGRPATSRHFHVAIPPPKTDGICPAYGSHTSPVLLEPKKKLNGNVMLISLKDHGSVSHIVDNFGYALHQAVKKKTVVLSKFLSKDGHHSTNVHEIVGMMADAAGTLAFINNHGVSHGDFKPGNMVVDANNKGFVTDFGNATAYGNIATQPTEGYVPYVYNYDYELKGDNYRSYIARDSVMDKMTLGGTILELLFGMPFSLTDDNEFRNILQRSASTPKGDDYSDAHYGPLRQYEGLLSKLRLGRNGTSIFLSEYTHVAFAGFSSFQTSSGTSTISHLCKLWSVSQQDQSVVQRLVTSKAKEFCKPSDMPINPALVRYVMQQVFEIGRMLYGETIEVLDGMNSVMEKADGISEKLMTDETTGGFYPEWYLLPRQKRQAYGFVTKLKIAETHMRWLMDCMYKNQISTFNILNGL